MFYVLRQVNVQVYILIIEQLVEELRIMTFTIFENLQDSDLSHVSKEFHEFADVFDKKEVDKLSFHRSYDHRIFLIKDAKPFQESIYNLSSIELNAL